LWVGDLAGRMTGLCKTAVGAKGFNLSAMKGKGALRVMRVRGMGKEATSVLWNGQRFHNCTKTGD